jgi:hypothetical protein
MNLVNPAIESKKDISEAVYFSIYKKGNESLSGLAKHNNFAEEGALYDKCYIAYHQAKTKYGEK